MPDNPRPVFDLRKSLAEARLIRATSQDMRAEALRERLSLGFTYCTLAETAIRHGGGEACTYAN